MEKDSVLEMMAHVDFNNPISTKIFFEDNDDIDDDDDIFVLQDICKENISGKILDNTSCGIDRNDEPSEGNPIVNDEDNVTVISAFQFDSPKKKINFKLKPENKICRENNISHYNDVTEITEKAKQNSLHENVNNQFQSEQSNLGRKHVNNSCTASSETTLKSLQTLTANASQPNSKRPKSSNLNAATIKRVCLDQNNNAKSLDSTESNNSQNVVDHNLQKMIKLISEHLIHILQFEKYFTKNCLNVMVNKDKLEKKKAAAKYHYFKLSYSTVLAVFIEQENNEQFVRNFIENTVKVGNSKGLTTNFTEVAILYAEMLTWTKREHYHITKTQNFVVEINNRLNTSVNNEPLQPVNGMSYKQPILQANQQSNQSLLQSNQSLLQSNQFVLQPNPPLLQSNQPLVQSNPPLLPSNLPSPVSQFQTYQTDQRDLRQTYNRAPLAPNHNSLYIPSYDPSKPTQASAVQQSRVAQSRVPQNRLPQSRAPQLPTYQQSYQTNLPSITQTMQERQGWQTTHPAACLLNNLAYSSVQDKQPLASILQDRVLARNTRSLSRDSGIASPSLNAETTREYQDDNQSLFQPIITQVTSQCPTYSHRNDPGDCCVCKRKTTKMCMGCYSIYYCSVECQLINFRHHVSSCKLRT